MSDLVVEQTYEVEPPDVSHLITEDDTPVDNLFSAKQQRLLVEPLYSSWQPPQEDPEHALRPFLADANVGVFSMPRNPALVPDVFLSLDVEVAEDWYAKEHRSYFIWEFGKPPEVVIEIVSNRKGGETEHKMREYARMRVGYYVIYDPQLLLQPTPLRIYELKVDKYHLKRTLLLERVGLGLTLWEGVFEGKQEQWLRWTDLERVVIPTGAERAEQERDRAEQERDRAEQERDRAEQEHDRAEQERARADEALGFLEQERARTAEAEARTARLLAQLRAAGIDPEI
jgi:Uma2 family endonuclease